MGDREAFIAAVFAAPADDTPRLVFADWLDEQGETGRAARLRGDGVWHLAPASFVGPFCKYPAEKGRRYLVWWPPGGPAFRAIDRSPDCVVGRAKRSYPKALGVRCHCGRGGGLVEFTGGAWHCSGCPPTEDGRAAWEEEQFRRQAELVGRLPWVGGDGTGR